MRWTIPLMPYLGEQRQGDSSGANPEAWGTLNQKETSRFVSSTLSVIDFCYWLLAYLSRDPQTKLPCHNFGKGVLPLMYIVVDSVFVRLDLLRLS